MYKKILIVSDNVHLCNELKDLLLDRCGAERSFDFSISPFSNRLQFSNELQLPVLIYDLKNKNDILNIQNRYDLIISIHCKQLFPKELVKNIKCINIHPGYNPINRGWYPQVFSIIHDLPIGATIHEMDEELDHGNIIARSFVNKEISDTSETLYNKIIQKEIELITINLDSILSNTYSTVTPECEGGLFLKKDFNNLCEFDLDEKLSMRQFVDRLRALSHGNYNNAYFLDPETGKKVYMTIDLNCEN